MKILSVIPTYLPAHEIGGPVKTTHDFCKTLARKGVEIDVYTTNINAFGCVEVPLNKPVDVEGVNVTYFPVRGPVAYSYAPDMGKAIRENILKYDLVHAHSVYLYPTLIAAKICQKKKVPYIINPFGALDPDMISLKSSFIKRIYIELVEKNNINKASAVQVASIYEKNRLLPLGFRSPVYIVPCAIDPKEYLLLGNKQILKERYPQLKNKKIILFMGRIHPKKGLDLLALAFAEIARKREEITLVIAGTGEERYVKKVKTMFKDKGLSSRTVFTGLLTGEEKISTLHESDVFVLPSYGENFGIAVIEAMACGLPVVVTDKVGLSLDINEYNAGIVTKCDTNEIASAILKILGNNELNEEIRIKAMKLVEDRFTLVKATDKMIKLYEEAGATG